MGKGGAGQRRDMQARQGGVGYRRPLKPALLIPADTRVDGGMLLQLWLQEVAATAAVAASLSTA